MELGGSDPAPTSESGWRPASRRPRHRQSLNSLASGNRLGAEISGDERESVERRGGDVSLVVGWATAQRKEVKRRNSGRLRFRVHGQRTTRIFHL